MLIILTLFNILLGCKTSFVLIEYANNLTIPDEVMNHPVITALGEAANDLVTWSNVSSNPTTQRHD